MVSLCLPKRFFTHELLTDLDKNFGKLGRLILKNNRKENAYKTKKALQIPLRILRFKGLILATYSHITAYITPLNNPLVELIDTIHYTSLSVFASTFLGFPLQIF